MSDILSQAEIDALLNGTNNDTSEANNQDDIDFSAAEADAIGEIGNISMGTAATTLFTLLGQKVMITTPQVSVTRWDELAQAHKGMAYVAVNIEYTEGLKGANLLILKEKDVKVIADLMMGSDGTEVEGELSELHLSAISEAMNQMIGSSATSMSAMFNKRIDISPPTAFKIDFLNKTPMVSFAEDQKIVKVAFRMVVGDLIDSEMMQLLPLEFAKELAKNLLTVDTADLAVQKVYEPSETSKASTTEKKVEPVSQNYKERRSSGMQQNDRYEYQPPKEPVNVQYAQFESFDEGVKAAERENINLIMDVPLEITVELGRTERLIREILEFVPGSIVELDKLAGEPIDILVNGKVIAKGEVVVIDESFGVRITDIVSPSKRL